MRILKTEWKKRSIKEQILIFTLLCSMAAAIALGVILFTLSKKTIENNYQSSHQYNLEVSSSIIDIHLKNIVELARTLLNNGTVKDILLGDTLEGTGFTSRNDITLRHVIGDLGEQNKYIRNILLVNLSGKIYFYSKLTLEYGSMQDYYKNGGILDKSWVKAADNANGKEIFFGSNVLFDDQNACFSMVKALRDTENGETLGYVVFNLKKNMMAGAFGRDDEGYSTNRYLIIDRNPVTAEDGGAGNMVYYHGGKEIEQEIIESYMEGSRGSYLFSETHNAMSGWEIVNVISRQELSRDSSYIGWITVLICLVLLVVCYLLASGISRVITRPLEMLEKTIQEVGNGNYQIEEEFDETEIGKLGSRFKNMVNNNLGLHEKLLHSEIREKEAELLLLQSQINPHFLYNTLDSLYFMAIIDGADDVAEMVLALSDTFKLSLNRGDKLIRVRDELEKVRAYMKIQNMRYHNRFDLQLQVEESLLDEKILTFILQPLVENAVYHGLEPKIGDGCYIRITGSVEREAVGTGAMVGVAAAGGTGSMGPEAPGTGAMGAETYTAPVRSCMSFRILDNGVGIGDMSKLDEGYGVRNIRERLRLFYGEEASVSFESELQRGTGVLVRLPFLKEREKPEGVIFTG